MNVKSVMIYVLSGPLKGHKYFVNTDRTLIIGREEGVTIRIDYDEFCSRRHALIYWEGHKSYVEDLESTNGTLLNNEPVRGRSELKSKDVISLGRTDLLIGIKEYPESQTESSK